MARHEKFNIDFAHPGRSLIPIKKSAFALLWHRLVSREIDIKLGSLIIAFMILISGTLFYVLGVYMPGNARITKLEKENKTLDIKYKALKAQHNSLAIKSEKLIEEVGKIKKAREKYFFWSDKLIEIKRQLVKSLWLYSLKVETIREKNEGNRNEKKGEKPAGKNKAKNEILFSDRFVGSPKFEVAIKGSTFSAPKKQPIRLISRFIEGLMGSPAWNKYFKLKDWKITSPESDADIINFELSLTSIP